MAGLRKCPTNVVKSSFRCASIWDIPTSQKVRAMRAAPLIPAATILVVRDQVDLQVLMVERHHQIDFASGALVFPGGKMSADDQKDAWAHHVVGLDRGAPFGGGLAIAAIREAFEESGILFAEDAKTGGPVSDSSLAQVSPHRHDVAAGKASFLALVADAGLRLRLDALTPFAHWITPLGMPKRFDTMFFIARAPRDQAALHDGCETVDAVWIRPQDALAQADAGVRKIIFPTRLNVELLAQSNSADAAVAAARARPLATVLPDVVPGPDGLELRIREDAGYSRTREPLAGNMP
jgi:8-oxo-dGTP pyrophosphatase MutT (NUDIX family)